MANKEDNPVPSLDKFIAMNVDGYYPDSIIDSLMFDNEQQVIEHIKNNIYPQEKKQFTHINCTIVDDYDICYETGKKLEYPQYRVHKLQNGVETD